MSEKNRPAPGDSKNIGDSNRSQSNGQLQKSSIPDFKFTPPPPPKPEDKK